jgi:flagellar biosynthetic protein FliS
MHPTETTYLRTAANGASGLALLVALYDTLAGDIRRAAGAQRENNLEQRAKEVKHALLVVSMLENWIEADSGDLARSLIRFYARLRRGLIEAQGKQAAGQMEQLMAEVLGIREIWQQMQEKNAFFEPEILPPVARVRQGGAFSRDPEQRSLSWSA